MSLRKSLINVNMSYKLKIKKFSESNDSRKVSVYNPSKILLESKPKVPIAIDINNEDNIFTFICSEINNIENNDFLKIIYKLEEKVRKSIENQYIENLSSKYTSFNFDIKWVDKEYKNLIIKQISEDLITENILNIIKKS